MMDFIWFCAAGFSCPLGFVLLLVSFVVLRLTQRRLYRCVGYVSLGLGWLLIGLAAMPFPCYGFVMVAILSLAGIWGGRVRNKLGKRAVNILAGGYVASILFMLLSFGYDSSLPRFPEKIQQITIIGDSVSAGIGGHDEKTWPLLLGECGVYEVLNLAASGATVNSAWHKQVPKVPVGKQLILLEIGGNDLFGPTPIDEFQRDLDAIISELTRQGHTVAMFELPLLPWQWQYGRVQRIVGQRHHIFIIPKRVLVSVFSQKGASSDLAHLTPDGHRLMAQTVERVLEGSY